MNLRSFLSKGLVLVMLFIFAIAATGCWPFGGEEETTLTEQQVQQKRVGTLKSLGGMSVGEGTHLLEVSGGHTIRLKSENIDLNQEKYLNNKVEVRGYIEKAEDGKDVMDVRSIDLDEDEMINGTEQEYKNADLGFSLTYLDSWEIESNDDEVTFTAAVPEEEVEDEAMEEDTEAAEDEEETESMEPDMIIVKRVPNPDKETVETYLELPDDPDELITLGYTQSLIGIDKLEGLKKESADKLEVDVWLARQEYVYIFRFVGADNETTLNNRNTFYSMLSTFKFIGMSDDEEEGDDEATEEEEEADLPELEEPEEYDEPEIEAAEPEEEDPVIEPEDETEDEKAPATSSSTYGAIAQYINETLDDIAPEASDSGSWQATNFEFVDPNYVYVEYSDGSADRRVLLTYDQNGSLRTEVIGYFEPGETTSWERVEGENPVESAEKTVISITDEGAEEAATVKEGYRYFESSPYDFNAQYPSNWYFSGTGGGDDAIHHYGFSNEPVEDGNELVSLDIVSGNLPSGSTVSLGSHSGIKIYDGGEVSIYIERDDGLLYKIHGGSENEQYIIDMAASIQEI